MAATTGRSSTGSTARREGEVEVVAVRISVSGPSEVKLWLLCGDGALLTLDGVTQRAALAVAGVVVRRRVTVGRVEDAPDTSFVELRRERRVGALRLGTSRIRLACSAVAYDTSDAH